MTSVCREDFHYRLDTASTLEWIDAELDKLE